MKENEFLCEGCVMTKTKSFYAIAQSAMGVSLNYTCDCGYITEL